MQDLTPIFALLRTALLMPVMALGGYGKQRILEIMKYPCASVYGVLGLLLMFLLKISVLNGITTAAVPWALLAVPAACRHCR